MLLPCVLLFQHIDATKHSFNKVSNTQKPAIQMEAGSLYCLGKPYFFAKKSLTCSGFITDSTNV